MAKGGNATRLINGGPCGHLTDTLQVYQILPALLPDMKYHDYITHAKKHPERVRIGNPANCYGFRSRRPVRYISRARTAATKIGNS